MLSRRTNENLARAVEPQRVLTPPIASVKPGALREPL